jgi:hypothetical protein
LAGCADSADQAEWIKYSDNRPQRSTTTVGRFLFITRPPFRGGPETAALREVDGNPKQCT